MGFATVVVGWQGAGQNPLTPGVALTLRYRRHILSHSIPRGCRNVPAPVSQAAHGFHCETRAFLPT